jgi:hypothetical protein
MGRSKHPSVLRSLAVAFGDGLAFAVAFHLAQRKGRHWEEDMTDLSPLVERLRKLEVRVEPPPAAGPEGHLKPADGLEGRTLDKVIVALEARLSEHIGQVERRLADMDAGVALDLNAVQTEITAQGSAVERALQKTEAELRDAVEAGRQQSAGQIAAMDQRLSALQEALPAKLREIVEAIDAAMNARIAAGIEVRVAGLQETVGRLAALPSAEAVRVELESRMAAERQSLEDELRRQAEEVNAVDQKMAVLQAELPPKLKAIVEALREALDARMAADLEAVSQRQEAALEQREAALRAEREDLPARVAEAADEVRRSVEGRLAAEIQALEKRTAEWAAALEKSFSEQAGRVDEKLELAQAELPSRFSTIVEAARESIEARLAVRLRALEEQQRGQMQMLEGRASTHSGEVERMQQHVSLLDTRMQGLEEKLQRHAEEAAARAAEAVWRSIEGRLLQDAAQAAGSGRTADTVSALRQKSTSAEQSVLDMIAGIGRLFERTAAPEAAAIPEEPPRAEAGAAREEVAAEAEPAAADVERAVTEAAAEAVQDTGAENPAPAQEESAREEQAPRVILFQPAEPNRKWRVPFAP